MDARKLLLAAATLAFFSSFYTSQASAQATTPLYAVLNGGNECNSTLPPTGPICRKGDLDGVGTATILFLSSTSLCFALAVDNLAGAAAAHIHRGVAGLNRVVVVTLTPPSAPGSGNPGASSGCLSALSSTLLHEMHHNPSAFYINVHNATYPGGAIRGQLF